MEAMVFHVPQKKMLLPQLNIAGMAIEFVSNFNFLGIKIYTNLNWLSHTNCVANKILKTGFKSIKRHIASKCSNCDIFFIDTMPPQLWHSSMGHQSNRLFKLHKRILRIITCIPYISHTAPLLKKTGHIEVK